MACATTSTFFHSQSFPICAIKICSVIKDLRVISLLPQTDVGELLGTRQVLLQGGDT